MSGVRTDLVWLCSQSVPDKNHCVFEEIGFVFYKSLMVLMAVVACSAAASQDQLVKVDRPLQSHVDHKTRPQLATGVAMAPDGKLWIVGLNEKQRLFVQSSSLEKLGRWSAPVEIETYGDAISADGENRPKIAFGPNGWVVISYTKPLAKPYAGFIRMLRSRDGGKTFSAPFTVHQDRQEITHRFESIAFDAQGDLHTVWIDKRDQPPRDSGQKYVGAAIYRNISHDGGVTFEPDVKLADHSCECCRIALVQDPSGTLKAMWRHVFGEQTRDHAFSNVATSTPNQIVRASYDEWQINACPHHGPGLSFNDSDSAGGYHAVWFGIRQEGGQSVGGVRYARLASNGEPVADTLKVIPDLRAEHADVRSFANKVAIVWRSFEGNKTTLKAWLSTDAGNTFEVKRMDEAAGYNDHPRLAQFGARMFIVWRQAEEVKTYEINF